MKETLSKALTIVAVIWLFINLALGILFASLGMILGLLLMLSEAAYVWIVVRKRKNKQKQTRKTLKNDLEERREQIVANKTTAKLSFYPLWNPSQA